MNKKIVNCKDCNKEVSKRAKTCPHCGVSYPAPGEGERIKWGTGIIMAFLIMYALMVIGEFSQDLWDFTGKIVNEE